MTLEERFELAAPPQAVWDFLLDPGTLTQAIPGCEGLALEAERTYRATVRVKIGFLTLRFRTKTTLTSVQPPVALDSVTEGEDLGLAGSFSAKSALRLREVPPGRTELTYRTQITLVGRLATFGNRLLEAKATQHAREFVAAVRKGVETPASA